MRIEVRIRPPKDLSRDTIDVLKIELKMNMLVDAGIDLGGLDLEEAEARVNWVEKNVKWWSWDDFIKKLELEPEVFWEYAYKKEQKYLEPTEKELPQALKSLHNAELKLFITSNNPNSGIRHKLRLAGFSEYDINHLFTDILGASEMQCMKRDAEYWRKAVRATGMPAEELIGAHSRNSPSIAKPPRGIENLI